MLSTPSRPNLSESPTVLLHTFLPLADGNDSVQGNLESQALKKAEQLLACILNDPVEQSCAFDLETHLGLLHERDVGCSFFKTLNVLGLFVIIAWIPLTNTHTVTMGLVHHRPGSSSQGKAVFSWSPQG